MALFRAAHLGRAEKRLAPLRAALAEELAVFAVSAAMFDRSAGTAMPLLQAEASAKRDMCSWPVCRVKVCRGSMRCAATAPSLPSTLVSLGRVDMLSWNCLVVTAKHPPLLHTDLGFVERQMRCTRRAATWSRRSFLGTLNTVCRRVGWLE